MIRVALVVFLIIASVGVPTGAQVQNAPPRAPDEQTQQSFGDAEGAAVLRAFANGLETHDLNRFLAAFDANAYPRFPVFAGEMDSYFGRYDEFRVHYLLKETSVDADGRGVMLAQMQLEGVPVGTGEAVRHNAEVRFELVRSDGKWKIASFTPREFLS